MHTEISSKTKTVLIGPDHPFTIIGERINPTGRKKLAAEMAAGNYERVIKDAIRQVEAGAHMLDVNAGIPLADEPAILAKAIKIVQSVTDVPISIDSSVIAALERGLEAYEGKPLSWWKSPPKIFACVKWSWMPASGLRPGRRRRLCNVKSLST